MIVTDGQLLLEAFTYNGPIKGTGVILGAGTVPALNNIATSCLYTSGNVRLIKNSTLSTYLSGLGSTILFDKVYADVTIAVKGANLLANFGYSSYTPILASTITPTWMLLLRPAHDSGTLTSGNSWLSSVTYSRHVFLLSLGTDMIMSSTLQAGLGFRIPNLSFPITNVVS
jgi:hypothetical protein